MHAIAHRYYRAWERSCNSCGMKVMSDLLLTIHLQCPNGCGKMQQAKQNTPPDIETVTEWLTCGIDAVCPEHREES